MSNKKKSMIALTLAGVLGVASLGIVRAVSAAEKTDNVAPRTVTVADFEDFRDVQSLVTSSYYEHQPIGTYNWTEEDDEKAIEGRSLILEAEGSLTESWSGYAKDSGRPIVLSYHLSHNVKNKGNWGFEWKYLDKLYLDIKNDNPFDARVSILMLAKSGHPLNFGSTTIPANTLKTVEVNVSRYCMQTEFVSSVMDQLVMMFNYDRKVLTEEECTECDHETRAECKAVGCVSRHFDYSEPGDLYYPSATFYIDNIKADLNENSIYNEKGAVIVDKKFESATEILNFNQSSDLEYVFETGGDYVKEADNQWVTPHWSMGTGSALYYNTNEKYIHEGNVGSLQWRIVPTLQSKYSASNYSYCTDFNYLTGYLMTGFTVAAPYLNYLNFSNLQSGKVKICVDVYNACGFDKEVSFGIHDMSGVATELKTSFPYAYNSYGPTDVWTKLPAGEWTTLELTKFDYLDLSKGLSRLRLNTTLFDVLEPVSFYVNNLRIEYVDQLA